MDGCPAGLSHSCPIKAQFGLHLLQVERALKTRLFVSLLSACSSSGNPELWKLVVKRFLELGSGWSWKQLLEITFLTFSFSKFTQSRLDRIVSRWGLNIPKEEDSTDSGQAVPVLCQTHSTKFFLILRRNFVCTSYSCCFLSHCWALSSRTWSIL